MCVFNDNTYMSFTFLGLSTKLVKKSYICRNKYTNNQKICFVLKTETLLDFQFEKVGRQYSK